MSVRASVCGSGAICFASALCETQRRYGLLVGGGRIHRQCDLCVPLCLGATEVLHLKVQRGL